MSTEFLRPQLLDAVLKHPSFTQDQQVYCGLLSTSHTVRTAVIALCGGQLPVQLTVTGRQKQKVLLLAAWLRQHAHLVQRLDLQLSDHKGHMEKRAKDDCWAEEVKAVGAALQHAASTAPLTLQHLSLGGSLITLELITALGSSPLVSLECQVPTQLAAREKLPMWYTFMASLSDLLQLQRLDIGKSGPLKAAQENVFEGLTRLKHLTQLQLGDATPQQLLPLVLSPNLKQLGAAIQMRSEQDDRALAVWLPKHAHLLTYLNITSEKALREGRIWELPDTPMAMLATGLKSAQSRAGGMLQLQRLSVTIQLSPEVYMHLAEACQLTSLECMMRTKQQTTRAFRFAAVVGDMQ